MWKLGRSTCREWRGPAQELSGAASVVLQRKRILNIVRNAAAAYKNDLHQEDIFCR